MNRIFNIALAICGLSLVIATVALFLTPMVIWLKNTVGVSTSGVDVFNSYYKSYIFRTITLSTASAFFATITGGSLACLSVFTSRKLGQALTVLMTFPLLIGFIARNYSWTGLLNQLVRSNGYDISLLLSFANSLQGTEAGVIVIMSSVFVPFCYFVARESFASLKVEYYEAARTLGAGDARSFLVITLPIGSRGLMRAFSLSTVLGVGYFITPALIGLGNHDFIGNGVLTLLNYGEISATSELALYMFLTIAFPTLLIVAISTYYEIRSKTMKVASADHEEESQLIDDKRKS